MDRSKVKAQVFYFCAWWNLQWYYLQVPTVNVSPWEHEVPEGKTKFLITSLWRVGQTRDVIASLSNGFLSPGHWCAGHCPRYDREVCHRHCLWAHLPVHLRALPNHHQVRANGNQKKTHSTRKHRTSGLHSAFQRSLCIEMLLQFNREA